MGPSKVVVGNMIHYKSHKLIAVVLCILCIMSFIQINMKQHDPKTITNIVVRVEHKPKRENTRTLMVRLIGGLGNHLWAYSSLYGLSKKTGRSPIGCFEYDIRELFSNVSIDLISSRRCEHRVQLFPNDSFEESQRESHLYYDIELIATLKKSKTRIAYISYYYLQNLGYFIEYQENIKAELTIREEYKLVAQHYLYMAIHEMGNRTKAQISRNRIGEVLLNGLPPVFVTVHVRRGDILDPEHINQPGPSYFKRAMDHFRGKHGKSVVFIVATDDLQWSRANITGDDVHFTADTGPKGREVEFAIAVSCNHTIMSVGTFGWWMGFLTGGDVIYPEDWVAGDWKPWYNPSQFFPHQWIPLKLSE